MRGGGSGGDSRLTMAPNIVGGGSEGVSEERVGGVWICSEIDWRGFPVRLRGIFSREFMCFLRKLPPAGA